MSRKAESLKIIEGMGFSVPIFYVIDDIDQKKLSVSNYRKKMVQQFSAWREKHDIKSVAIRSSASVEDGVDKSFAGQFLSVMPVESDAEFLEAISKVVTSKPDESYDLSDKFQMDVIVQQYIEPDIAGVLFTINPSVGRSEVVINATRGHGVAVVEGISDTTIIVPRNGKLVKSPSDLISRKLLAELHKLSLAIEKQFGHPQDIEWAIKGSNVYILQARPISSISYLQVWDSSNISESFPGLVSPLTFSIARRGYELVYKSQAAAAGLGWVQIEQHQNIFRNMVGIFGGRMYYNLASWYEFISLFPGNRSNQKYLDDQLSTLGASLYFPDHTSSIYFRIRFYLNLAKRGVFFNREMRHFWGQLEEKFERYEDLNPQQSAAAFIKRYEYIEENIIPLMGRSADNDFFVMKYHGVLKKKLELWLKGSEFQQTDFIGSMRDVISARQAELLIQIAEKINQDRQALKLLKQKKYDELDEYLSKSPINIPLTEYRSDFLHRYAGDQIIESVNPLLDHKAFYSLIEVYIEAKIDLKHKLVENERLEDNRQRALLNKLRPHQKIAYRFLISRLKHHLRIRERNRLLRGKAYAYLRELFASFDAWATENIDLKQGQIYYFQIEELKDLFGGVVMGNDIHQIIKSRIDHQDKFSKLQLKDRFVTRSTTDGIPYEAIGQIEHSSEGSLAGIISSPGDVTGRVVVLEKPQIPKKPFDILVVKHTDPGWTPLIALAKGVIVERGGILSHAAIVTRELGIPSIIGVDNATTKLKTGMKVKINTAGQAVELLSNNGKN